MTTTTTTAAAAITAVAAFGSPMQPHVSIKFAM
jgi:hypothetical protein